MKHISRKSTIVALLLLSSQLTSFNASAEVSQTDRQKLEEISRIELINGKIDFMVAEFLKDGLLQENEGIDFTYNAKKVTLNGKDVPEQYNSRYVQMLLKGGFAKDSISNGSYRSGGHRISELKSLERLNSAELNRQTYDRLIRLLVEDKIVESAENLTIDIAADYVAVNGRVLASPVEKAYAKHFRELSGFKPAGSEVFSITIKHALQ